METREYPYGKSILLNAVYDVLDRLGLPIAFADSQAGALQFLHGAASGRMELTALLRNGEEVTRIQVADADGALQAALLDEIASALHQNLETDIRSTAK